jgi:hypothetical protein
MTSFLSFQTKSQDEQQPVESVRTCIIRAPTYHLLRVLDPFNTAYPTAVLTSFPSGALFARFDPTGRLIAAGRPDGALLILDLNIKDTARVYEWHVKALVSAKYVWLAALSSKYTFLYED